MAPTVTLNLQNGPILAYREDGIIHARGIPYAKAGRFQLPQDVPPNGDVLDCTKPAPICPQEPSRLAKIMGDIHEGHSQSEDCLSLTITAPENVTDAPVMVYFHGGAYASGGGDLDVYNGQQLSAQERVVVVRVTYRLSIFGYLRIPGLAPANLGLMDQIAALRWVQANISSFGGNKDNVTIFGQSAGGDSVFCMLLAESAKGLFHRAIIQSAPFGWYFDEKKQNMVKVMGQQAAESLAKKQEYSSDEMLAIKKKLQVIGVKENPETVLFYCTELGEQPLPPVATVDDVLKEAAKKIQIMIGWTKDEGTAFAASPNSAEATAITKWFVDGVQHYHNIIKQEQKSPSYTFEWSPSESPYGAVHCIELPFLFGDANAWKSAAMLGDGSSRKIVNDLGVQVKKFWATFARGKVLTEAHITIDENFNCAEHVSTNAS